MAGRGGRGAGRGGMNKSFNREQLNALGVGGKELLPGLVTQPPPLYPLMDRKPVPLTPTMETDYLLILKQDFIDQMQLSGAFLKMPADKAAPLEAELDRLVTLPPKEKYDWTLFPSELRPKLLAKRLSRQNKEINIQQRLSVLEALEGKIKEPQTVKEEDNESLASAEEEDEEMDDGTDYANNYFDNGEDYEEEDDNLDDGPIY